MVLVRDHRSEESAEGFFAVYPSFFYSYFFE
jgi:hypothetical protein